MSYRTCITVSVERHTVRHAGRWVGSPMAALGPFWSRAQDCTRPRLSLLSGGLRNWKLLQMCTLEPVCRSSSCYRGSDAI
eukprot:5162537-Amphidinium_carterae.1